MKIGHAFLALALAACAFVPGCALFRAEVPALSEVAGDIADAQAVVDSVEASVRAFFLQNPNPEKEQVLEAAIANCRMGIDAAVRALRGAQELDEGKILAAYADFRDAWDDLQRALRWAGIAGQGGRMKTAGGPLGFPTPLMIRR